MMRLLMKLVLPALLVVALTALAAPALEGHGPRNAEDGNGVPPRGSELAPGQEQGRPTLIIRGKGGKITDVERQGVQPDARPVPKPGGRPND